MQRKCAASLACEHSAPLHQQHGHSLGTTARSDQEVSHLARRGTTTEQEAFDDVKRAISHETILAYFDKRWTSHLYVDASPLGLGAILCQLDDSGNMRPISFASRSLSGMEKRYSQTEREALAVKYGCLKFHPYPSSDPQFTVHTDHKPLLQLLRPGSRLPPRIERMALAVQDLTFTLEYNPGAGNPADVPSRHLQYIVAILRAATPNAVTLEDIHVAMGGDSELQAVLASLQTGDWRIEVKKKKKKDVPSLNFSIAALA